MRGRHKMAISASDIQIHYSGGLFNGDPLKSLGGLMSQIVVGSNTSDNLFDTTPDIILKQLFQDYRAVYVANTSEKDTLYDVVLYYNKTEEEPSRIRIGVKRQNEIQTINFLDFTSITDGSFTLKFDTQVTSKIQWHSDADTFGQRIQTELRALARLSDVEVDSPVISVDAAAYPIYFVGADRNKLHPNLSVNTNQLAAAGKPATITTSVIQPGSPINEVAVDVAFRNNPPAGVSFVIASKDSPINVGTLHPGESFAVWIQRSIPASNTTSTSVDEDSFGLVVRGTASPIT